MFRGVLIASILIGVSFARVDPCGFDSSAVRCGPGERGARRRLALRPAQRGSPCAMQQTASLRFTPEDCGTLSGCRGRAHSCSEAGAKRVGASPHTPYGYHQREPVEPREPPRGCVSPQPTTRVSANIRGCGGSPPLASHPLWIKAAPACTPQCGKLKALRKAPRPPPAAVCVARLFLRDHLVVPHSPAERVGRWRPGRGTRPADPVSTALVRQGCAHRG